MDILITNAGMAALINAEKTGTNAVKITELAVGSAKYTADKTQTKLKAETKRLPIVEAAKAGDTGIHVGVRDDSIDAYSVFEFGLLLEDGTLFAVYSQNVPILTKTADSIAQMVVDVALEGVKTERITFGDVHYDFPAASEANAGIVELATQGEAEAGTDALRVVTVKVLAALKAREDLAGIIRKASSAETLAGVADDAAVTPKTLQDRIATDDDVDAGTVGKILTTDVAKREMNILEKSIEAMYAANRTGKVYGVKIPKYSSNTSSACVKTHDNVDLVCEVSSGTVTGRDDYAKIPLFRYIDVNYVRDDDGFARPTALKGTNDFKETGAVDVGCMQMTFWAKWDTTSDPENTIVMISDMPHPELGLEPWCEAVKADGTVMPWFIGSKYFSGIAEDGNLRSQPRLTLKADQSAFGQIAAYAKKGTGYWGGHSASNVFQMIFGVIKYGTKHFQSKFTGYTNFSWVASPCTLAESGVKRVVVAGGANFNVGANCLIGTWTDEQIQESATDIGRYAENTFNISGRDGLCVTRVESLADGNKALYFDDAPEVFNTTANTRVYGVPQASGTTDALPEHCDGQIENSGFWPYRLQGREYAVGTYFVPNNIWLEADGEAGWTYWYAKPGHARFDSEVKCKESYKSVHVASLGTDNHYVADIDVDVTCGVWWPIAAGGSASTGWADYRYSNASKESQGVTREFLMGGNLSSGAHGGPACGNVGYSVWNGYWHYAARD